MANSKSRRPNQKELRARAKSAGAQSVGDFALFARLARTHHNIRIMAEIWGSKITRPIRKKLLYYDFLIDRGRFFSEQFLPSDYQYGEPNQCYGNSFDLAMERRELTYCEGFLAMPVRNKEPFDVRHAWCITADGAVIDVTFDGVAGMSYFGVAYTKEEIAQFGGGKNLPLVDEMVASRVPEGKRPRAIRD